MNDALQIDVTDDRTNWRAFPLVFGLVLFFLLFAGGLLSFIAVGRFLPTFGLFNQMLILSLIVGAGASLGNRLKQLVIRHEKLAQAELRDLAVDAIESCGFTCHHRSKKCTFRNNKKIHRLFADWLGTEQIILTSDQEGISVLGPGRYLNDLKTRMEIQESEIK